MSDKVGKGSGWNGEARRLGGCDMLFPPPKYSEFANEFAPDCFRAFDEDRDHILFSVCERLGLAKRGLVDSGA